MKALVRTLLGGEEYSRLRGNRTAILKLAAVRAKKWSAGDMLVTVDMWSDRLLCWKRVTQYHAGRRIG